MKKLYEINIKKIYTVCLVFFPILSIYNLGISTLTLADALLIIVLPFCMWRLYKKRNQRIEKDNKLMGIAFLILIQTLIYYTIDIMSASNLFSALRILLYYFILAFFTKELFDLQFGTNVYKKVSCFSAILFIVQLVALKAFNVFIPGTLPWKSTCVDEYNNIMKNHAWTSSAYARPRSLFAEPSHLAVYMALALAILLLCDKEKDWKKIVLITCAMLLSGSGMAIVLCLIIFLIFGLKNIKSLTNKKLIVIMIIGISFMPIFLYYIQSEPFKIFYKRTFIEQDSTKGRFGNFSDGFDRTKIYYVDT